ncbi:pentatricopeptide repeat-containing protein At2g01860-like [Nymphaea colorata]|nr:pentatricopeptide repeat-containing protein At2g01860-like [Nymphaea colorata]XP_031478250.1 pentatricopeptide repeat-containing protein At2g01860-like [Nymphaea colorata]XP_031478251.1 pentatricopeptide repeat-containing protein At2g01860-like [Nymphaea colorata]XP_031478253.1 pentatricopeptide repeat-containing protein At2g01860-like [Nymphaea colorata]XP_031478255.1 pentatricopeptide repeat-containing protein At2g01860-like [Nymphaea colorata]XP_049932268.1 pentatricopeptide repeat-conta
MSCLVTPCWFSWRDMSLVRENMASTGELRHRNAYRFIHMVVRKPASGSKRKVPKNLRYPRRAKVPPDPDIDRMRRRKQLADTGPSTSVEEEDDSWSEEALDAISSLFQGRVPQKPGKLGRERPLPLPVPFKIRPLGLPTPKDHIRSVASSLASSRSSLCKRVYKNPTFLIELAREIRDLPPEKNVSKVLDKWIAVLRKGSLSMTIRELGHMGLPQRALETFCWAKQHPQLFPDDRVLGSVVEILARFSKLKMPKDMENFMGSASKSVIEAMVRGFIRAGKDGTARKLLSIAKDAERTLDPSVLAKLIADVAKNPEKQELVSVLLEELGNREELKLKQQDCTALMKVCTKLGRFEAAESLFTWFKNSGQKPSVVMYTTLIHSRYSSKRYREAMAATWELEELNHLLDLPAYRVVIRLCVALDDLPRAVRYFSRLKEAGFCPTYDIYRDMIKLYAQNGRVAKCKEVSKEAELEGFKLDKETTSLLQIKGELGPLRSSTS